MSGGVCDGTPSRSEDAQRVFNRHVASKTEPECPFATVGGAVRLGQLLQTLHGLGSVARIALYRVAQEALTNVARHAKASTVEVTLKKLGDAISLTIKDNGRSFQSRRVKHSKTNTGLGLVGMRERLEMVGGSLSVEPAPGRGTTIRAQVPIEQITRGTDRR